MIREHRMISQSELAEAVGASRSAVNHIENGRSRITVEQAERMATVLLCKLGDLCAPIDAPMPRIRSLSGDQASRLRADRSRLRRQHAPHASDGADAERLFRRPD